MGTAVDGHGDKARNHFVWGKAAVLRPLTTLVVIADGRLSRIGPRGPCLLLQHTVHVWVGIPPGEFAGLHCNGAGRITPKAIR